MKKHLYYGDNLDVLRESIADESIDLIYLDPPFNSQSTYNLLFRSPAGEQSKPRSCVGSAGCEDRPCRRRDARQTDDGRGRRESHALEPGKPRRNRLPTPVEASPTAPDGQDHGLRRTAC